MLYHCPENHESDSPEFCSVCGIEIPRGAAEAPATASAAVATGEHCPDCETPRETPTQIYCEVCGFNFRTKASGVPIPSAASTEGTAQAEIKAPAASPVTEPCSSTSTSMPVQVWSQARWGVVVEVDPCLYGTKNADAPVDQPTRTFTLFEPESMIGRGGTDVRVQVPIVNDIGVSRRQALLVRQSGGGLVLRDLSSTNGTQLNGVDVVAGADVPLKDGDRISMGAWTRITVHANHT